MVQGEKIVVAAGQLYSDIDVLACAIAYSELLNIQGKVSFASLTGKFNKSITKTVKTWKFSYIKTLPKGNLSFVIVDMSNPDYFAKFVDKEKVIEIYDHHQGFDKYWKGKLGKNAHIETIGACATLIWEQYRKRYKENDISTVSANLLITAIISNTLNLKASITKKRDLDALRELKKYSSLPDNWTEIYFKEQEEEVLKNLAGSIIGDTMTLDSPLFKDGLIIGQLELWNSRKFITNSKKEIEKIYSKYGSPYWFLTSPSIDEGKNYIFSTNSEVKKLLEKNLAIKFKDNIAETTRLILRKELRKILLEGKK